MAEATVDLAAIRHNIEVLRRLAGGTPLMAVVKADGYGHGAAPVAMAAIAGGATRLGTATIPEAIALREAGIEAPVLAWLHEAPYEFLPAIAAGIDLGVGDPEVLEAVVAASKCSLGAPIPVIHLKLDTGLSRNGVAEQQWKSVFARARSLELEGVLRVDGVFSHLANTSADDDDAQITTFRRGISALHEAGLRPSVRHLASTAAAISKPAARFDLVRTGVGIYGLSPFGAQPPETVPDLIPAMSLRASIAAIRHVEPGVGVSYDATWRATRATTLALVPLGYADGVPRAASGSAEVTIAGRRYPVVGRIAMDQFIVDVGDAAIAVGDAVVVFGNPSLNEPGADELATAAGTNTYEIVSRIGARVRRTYSGELAE